MAEGEITTFTALTERFGLPLGNYKKPKLLYCSNGGHFLRILPDGKVDGTRDRSDQHSKDRPGCLALLLACVPCIAWSALPAGSSLARACRWRYSQEGQPAGVLITGDVIEGLIAACRQAGSWKRGEELQPCAHPQPSHLI